MYLKTLNYKNQLQVHNSRKLSHSCIVFLLLVSEQEKRNMDGYKKMNKAVVVCSTIQAIRPKSKSVHHVVPVTFDYSTQKPKLMNQGKNLEVDNIEEDSFTNYTNRVRIGMRTKLTVGDYAPIFDNLSDCQDDENSKDSAERDEFSEYLDRARVKIRTTSSIPAARFS